MRRNSAQDGFFQREDIFVAAAIALGRIDEAITLYESIVARTVDPKERADHEREERRRARRKPNPKYPLAAMPMPFWHDEARTRLEILRGLRPQ